MINDSDIIAALFLEVGDLAQVRRALARETVIRQTMAETGEDRQTVTDTLDALTSMGQEAVLDLAEGEPTTLADALRRYIDSLPGPNGEAADWDVAADLTALLAYPWPGLCAACQPDNTVLKVDSPDR